MKLKDLKDKKILILGFGKEGRNTFQALRYLFPKKELAIADKKKINILFKNINLFTGDNYLKVIKDYNIIIKTPGISFKKIKPYLNSKKKVTSQTELFLNNFQGKVIGITGTKGKGTSASLIYNILKNNGFKVGLGGNIGKPVLYDLVKKRIPKIFVYELSAQQLENINCSPHIAVFLNLYPAHLNFFQNIKKYKKAKSNICLYQNKEDYFIFYKNQDFLKKLSKKTKAKTISFKEKEIKKIKEKLGNIYLKGDFNYLNILAAFKVAKMFNITENKIIDIVKKFKTLPHRLEFVGKKKGIKFYNDSLATVPKATILGIKTFQNNLQTLITGGEDNNLKLNDLAKEILKSNIKNLILFPETGEGIQELIKKKKNNIDCFLVDNMKDAIKLAFKYTSKTKVCLLSPGAPSLNLFKNYKQRGELFKKYINKF